MQWIIIVSTVGKSIHTGKRRDGSADETQEEMKDFLQLTIWKIILTGVNRAI